MINLNMVSDYGTSVGALASKDFLGETWVWNWKYLTETFGEYSKQ
jgi:hypothetical protein